MKAQDLSIAILATNGFEQSELQEPLTALKNAGFKVDIISPEKNQIKGWAQKDWGTPVAVDRTLDSVKPENYDALVLPGGVINPDTLRLDDKAISLLNIL